MHQSILQKETHYILSGLNICFNICTLQDLLFTWKELVHLILVHFESHFTLQLLEKICYIHLVCLFLLKSKSLAKNKNTTNEKKQTKRNHNTTNDTNGSKNINYKFSKFEEVEKINHDTISIHFNLLNFLCYLSKSI